MDNDDDNGGFQIEVDSTLESQLRSLHHIGMVLEYLVLLRHCTYLRGVHMHYNNRPEHEKSSDGLPLSC